MPSGTGQVLTSWLLKKVSVWTGSICTEMSHILVVFLGFCSFSLRSWSFCFSWEVLGAEKMSLSQEGGWLHKVWEPQTTFVLTSRSGKGTPRLQGTEILEPSSSCPRVSGKVSLLASDQGGRHLSTPASCTGSAGHLLWIFMGPCSACLLFLTPGICQPFYFS